MKTIQRFETVDLTITQYPSILEDESVRLIRATITWNLCLDVDSSGVNGISFEVPDQIAVFQGVPRDHVGPVTPETLESFKVAIKDVKTILDRDSSSRQFRIKPIQINFNSTAAVGWSVNFLAG